MRPPCPICRHRMFYDRGLLDEEIFGCTLHGYWIPGMLVDKHGDELPIFRWQRYDWRT